MFCQITNEGQIVNFVSSTFSDLDLLLHQSFWSVHNADTQLSDDLDFLLGSVIHCQWGQFVSMCHVF